MTIHESFIIDCRKLGYRICEHGGHVWIYPLNGRGFGDELFSLNAYADARKADSHFFDKVADILAQERDRDTSLA